MSNLVPRSPRSLSTTGSRVPSSFSRAEGKALQRAENAEITEGLVAGTRLASQGFVTAFAIQQLGMLQREADHQFTGDPRHDARQQYLLDRFAEGAGQIIRSFD